MKVRKGRLRLSPNEEAQLIKDETEKRRKLRLLQVREQSKENAAKIRNSVKQEKHKQLMKLATDIKVWDFIICCSHNVSNFYGYVTVCLKRWILSVLHSLRTCLVKKKIHCFGYGDIYFQQTAVLEIILYVIFQNFLTGNFLLSGPVRGREGRACPTSRTAVWQQSTKHWSWA